MVSLSSLGHRFSRAVLIRTSVPLLFGLLAVVLVAACDSGGVTDPEPESLRLSISDLEITVGDTARLRALRGNGANSLVLGEGITWKSSDPSIATVDDAGLVTAQDPGNTVVIASSDLGSDSAQVKVHGKRLIISPRTDTLDAPGDTVRLVASVTNHKGNELSGNGVAWTSLNTSVAEVSASGLVTARAAGTARILADVQGDVDTATVYVLASAKASLQEPNTISISPGSHSLNAVGDTVRLVATLRDPHDNIVSNAEITWTSLNPEVAIVDTAGRVISRAVGVALIVAACDAATDTATITSRQLVASVSVSPGSATIAAGDTLHLSATASDSNGVHIPDADFTWSSSDPAVATVADGGVVSGVATGVASIAAKTGGKAGTAAIEVEAPISSAPEPEEPTEPSTGEPDFAAVVDGIRPRGFAAVPYTLKQPVNGGRVYYVAPDGSDSNAGSSSSPFRTINKAAQVARAGDVVTIRAGTYEESVFVNHGGTVDAPIVFQAVDRGSVVLTGGRYHFVPDNWSGGVRQSGPVFVTLRGLVFRDYGPTGSDIGYRNRAAVGAIRGWRIEDCLFDRAGYNGLEIRGDDVTVVRSTFQYNHTNAVHAWGPEGDPIEGAKLIDVILRGNNTRSDPLSGAISEKSVKFFRTTGAVIDNIESYENNGPGMWFDHGNTHFVVRNSYFHHNQGESGRGLFIEISWAPGRVENNVFAYNDRGLALVNSQGVTVTGNLFVGNGRTVALINADRGPEYPLKDIRITGNYFKGWNDASALHPGGNNITTPAQMNITADHNVYDPGEREALTYWDHTGWITSMSEIRSKLGWEQNGRIGSIAWPQ